MTGYTEHWIYISRSEIIGFSSVIQPSCMFQKISDHLWHFPGTPLAIREREGRTLQHH
jgi:hypothetical protein